MPIDPETRRAVLLMISRGHADVADAARMAGVSRQIVRHWCKRARISLTAAREARLSKEWR